MVFDSDNPHRFNKSSNRYVMFFGERLYLIQTPFERLIEIKNRPIDVFRTRRPKVCQLEHLLYLSAQPTRPFRDAYNDGADGIRNLAAVPF